MHDIVYVYNIKDEFEGDGAYLRIVGSVVLFVIS